MHKQHQDTHNAPSSSICDFCGKGFKNRRYLSGHIKSVHSDESYLCTDCGKSFRQQSGYRSHRHLKHSSEPPERIRCELCEKTFVTRTTLRLHQAVAHGRGSVLSCEECPTKFVSAAKLREHVRARHLGVKHRCEHCGRDFNHSFSVKKHVKLGKCPALKVKEEGKAKEEASTVMNST